MKIIASELSESVLCTLPNGDHVEVTMLCVEGDDYVAVPDVEGAIDILVSHLDIG